MRVRRQTKDRLIISMQLAAASDSTQRMHQHNAIH